MDDGRIGVDIADFMMGSRKAIELAAELGVGAIELPMVSGELAPANLSQSGRRHISRFIRGLGLDFCAIVGDMPGELRLTDAATNTEVVDRTRALLLLARQMRVPIVTAAVSALTHPDTGEWSPHAWEALRQIGADASATGTIYALRPTDDSAERIGRLLAELNCSYIRLCFDPAAMVIAGHDPAEVVRIAGDHIVLSHVRDAAAATSEQAAVEKPLGEGDVDLMGCLQMLHACGYHGPLIVRRRNSEHPVAEISEAREYLRKLLSSVG